MFYVFDSATNSHVFTMTDPTLDGYCGPKEDDVKLDEGFDMTIRPGDEYPIPFLAGPWKTASFSVCSATGKNALRLDSSQLHRTRTLKIGIGSRIERPMLTRIFPRWPTSSSRGFGRRRSPEQPR